MSCGIGQQLATAPIQPLAWELPYAASAALKSKKKKKKKEYTDQFISYTVIYTCPIFDSVWSNINA